MAITDPTTARCPACYLDDILAEDIQDHLRGFHGWSEPLIAAWVAAGAGAPFDTKVLAARVRDQLAAALGAAELAEHLAVVWSDQIGHHGEQAEISYRGGPRVPDHLWQARDHDAALALCGPLRQAVEAARQALAAWDAGVEEGGAHRRERPQ